MFGLRPEAGACCCARATRIGLPDTIAAVAARVVPTSSMLRRLTALSFMFDLFSLLSLDISRSAVLMTCRFRRRSWTYSPRPRGRDSGGDNSRRSAPSAICGLALLQGNIGLPYAEGAAG